MSWLSNCETSGELTSIRYAKNSDQNIKIMGVKSNAPKRVGIYFLMNE